VSRHTISGRLAKYNEKEYQNIAKHRIFTAGTKELPMPLPELFERWKNGESPENLEKLCKISYRQLLEKPKTYDPPRHKAVAEGRGLGSIRAKRLGARSLVQKRRERRSHDGFDDEPSG